MKSWRKKLVVDNALTELGLVVADDIYCEKEYCWGNLRMSRKLAELALNEGECTTIDDLVELGERIYNVVIRICRHNEAKNISPYYFKAYVYRISDIS